MESVEQLMERKNRLKREIKTLKEQNADPAVIAPVFEEYQKISAQLKEDAGRSAGQGGGGGGSGGEPQMTRAQLEERKNALKLEIKRAKLEGRAPESIQLVYDEYIKTKKQLENMENGAIAVAAPAPAVGAAATAPAAPAPSSSIPSMDELVGYKERAKRAVKDAKARDPSDVEGIRVVFDLYQQLKQDIVQYPHISDAWQQVAGGLGEGAGSAGGGAAAAAAQAAGAGGGGGRPTLSGAEAETKGEQLWVAAKKGDAILVQDLVSEGAPLQLCAQHGAPPLVMAALGGHYGVTKVLLDAGAGVDTRASEDDVTPLYVAAQQGHVEVLRLLLERGAAPEAPNTVAQVTALWIAAFVGQHKTLQALIAAGANINAVKHDTAASALSVAVENGKLACVRALLDAGADPESPDAEGFTCLAVAAQHQNTAIIEALLRAGANIEARTAAGDTPVEIAASCGFRAVVDTLMDAGAVVGPNSEVHKMMDL